MLSAIIQGLECLISLYFIGLVGFILDRRGWCAPETKNFLPRLVTLVALPPYLFVNVLNTFTREEFTRLIPGVLAPLASILLSFTLSLLLVRLFKISRPRRGLITTGCAASNTIFMGLPINVALFGEAALPYVLLYFFANSFFFWTLGQYALSRDGDRPRATTDWPGRLSRIFSPPLIGFGLGIIVLLSGHNPPKTILNSAALLGSLTTPLALLFIGLSLGRLDAATLKPDRDLALVLLGRFILCPLTMILQACFFEMTPLMFKVFLVQSSLPPPTSLALLAGYYRADLAFGSRVVAVGTVMSMLVIPLVLAFINLFQAG
ncbi:MAG: AEC family transporter [Candidatus Adiutrix sp.]|jgi:predicted permease|nr:AEC family transporter [Candidatus Adiutrix sp.]